MKLEKYTCDHCFTPIFAGKRIYEIQIVSKIVRIGWIKDITSNTIDKKYLCEKCYESLIDTAESKI